MIDNNNIVGLTHIYTNDLNNNDCLPMLETPSVFCSQSQFKRSSPLSLPPSPQPPLSINHDTLNAMQQTQCLISTKKTAKADARLRLQQKCECCACPIDDPYYLMLMNRPWHMACLRCCECKSGLESHISCFFKDGQIFCKEDYFRKFPRRCQDCGIAILPNELVMKSRNFIYHRNCFKCIICAKQLLTGDEYGSLNGSIYCRMHYFSCFSELHDNSIKSEQEATGGQQPPATDIYTTPFSPTCIFNMDQQQAVYQQFDTYASAIGPASGSGASVYASHNMPPTPNYSPPSSSSSTRSNILKQQQQNNNSEQSDNNNNSKQGSNNQKGRPKKRKLSATSTAQSKDTSKSIKSQASPTRLPLAAKIKRNNSIDDMSSPDFKDFGNRLDYFSDENSCTAGDSDQSCNNNNNGTSSNPTMGSTSVYDSIGPMSAAAAAAAAQRQKRMRTSFKHHQLRVMKSYFELNHNPDAKDLKQLSQKTGLSKRVLQVWFQNARAKYRRNQTNTDPNSDTANPTTTMQHGNGSPSSSPLSSVALCTRLQQSSSNSSSTGGGLLLAQTSTTTTDLTLSIDDLNVLNNNQHHHRNLQQQQQQQPYHHNSTTETSSLNDLDLICNDFEDEVDEDDDENDDDENNNNNNNDDDTTDDLTDNLNNNFEFGGNEENNLLNFTNRAKFKANTNHMPNHQRHHHHHHHMHMHQLHDNNTDDLIMH